MIALDATRRRPQRAEHGRQDGARPGARARMAGLPGAVAGAWRPDDGGGDRRSDKLNRGEARSGRRANRPQLLVRPRSFLPSVNVPLAMSPPAFWRARPRALGGVPVEGYRQHDFHAVVWWKIVCGGHLLAVEGEGPDGGLVSRFSSDRDSSGRRIVLTLLERQLEAASRAGPSQVPFHVPKRSLAAARRRPAAPAYPPRPPATRSRREEEFSHRCSPGSEREYLSRKAVKSDQAMFKSSSPPSAPRPQRETVRARRSRRPRR